jgi:tetratricopeptide (TPR) repeat protein
VNDQEAVAAFPDGVLWSYLGTTPDLPGQLQAWRRALGLADAGAEESVEEARLRLAAHLRDRRVLLVIDDVWEPEHAQPLLVGGVRCRTLLTTRNTRVAEALAAPADIYRLECLSEEDSVKLLQVLAPEVVERHPKECAELSRELEGLPLALQVAGRLLHVEASRGWSVEELLRELRSGAELLKRQAPPQMAEVLGQAAPTVVVLLKKSTDTLNETDRGRFAALGGLREKPAPFNLRAMSAAWGTEDPKPTVDEGNLREAVATFSRQEALASELGDQKQRSCALVDLGNTFLRAGDRSQALVCYRKSAAIAIQSGDRLGEGIARYNVARLYARAGRYAEACSLCGQALRLLEGVGAREADLVRRKLAEWRAADLGSFSFEISQ